MNTNLKAFTKALDLPDFFTQINKSVIGLDSLLPTSLSYINEVGFPPYNIEKLGDDQYVISIAIAGFAEDEIDISLKDYVLEVSGSKKTDINNDGKNYLYRGIAERDFKRTYRLENHVKVEGANLANGILTIKLIREVPEEQKARKITINK